MSQAGAVPALAVLLEKVQSQDKDFRYMALADLSQGLRDGSWSMDAEQQKRICQSVLRGVEDHIGEVAAMAVKCLPPLAQRVDHNNLRPLVEELCTKACSGQTGGQQAAVGIKTMLSEVGNGTRSAVVVHAAVPMLLQALQRHQQHAPMVEGTNGEVMLDVLDILQEAATRNGSACMDVMQQLMDSLTGLLSDRRSAVRKRAIQCIAALSPCLDEATYESICRKLVVSLGGEKGTYVFKASVQLAGAICRYSGTKMGRHVPEILPALILCAKNADETEEEQREISIQSIEMFVRKCTVNVRPNKDEILAVGLEYIKYDPNYNADFESNSEDMDEEASDEESDEGYSDDDDTSWKVRRASAKLLSAMVQSMPDLLCYYYENIAPSIILRMKEREENVRIDVYDVFQDIIRQTGVSNCTSARIPQKPGHYLQQLLPSLLKCISRELRGKSSKGKLAALQLLRNLVASLPGGMSDQIDELLPVLLKITKEEASSSNVKIESLTVLELLMVSHHLDVFRSYIQDMAEVIFSSTKEKYYRVITEALRCCKALVRLIHSSQPGGTFDCQDLVPELYSCVLLRLSEQDQDLQVKEESIRCMATVISCLEKYVGKQASGGLQIMLDRVRNEATRLTAIKAFETIALSPARECINIHTQALVEDLTLFLRKADRRLRQAALSTLDAIVKTASPPLDILFCDTIIVEVSGMLSDSDWHLSSMAFGLLCSVVTQQPCCAAAISDSALKPTFELLKSPLLQGSILEPIQELIRLLVQSEQPETGFESLYSMLMSAGETASSRQQIHSIAKIVASLCSTAGDQACQSSVDALVVRLQTSEDNMVLPLFCLGEIGKLKDVGLFSASEPMILKCFGSPMEEVKSAASFALGCMVAGNAHKYLPELIAQIESSPKQEYLLLHALKEVIVTLCAGSECKILGEDCERIFQILLKHAQNEEEGIRNVVAECLGKLVLMASEDIVMQLQRAASSENPNVRATVATSIRFTLQDKPHHVDDWLQPCLPTFLYLMQDSSWYVRKAAVQTLNSIVHSRLDMLGDMLPELTILVCKQTAVLPELVRTVDLGPFKHIVDDGLELRKAAFECLSSIMERSFDSVDLNQFIICLKEGIADHYDVKVPCHLLLAKIAELHGQSVLLAVDELVPNLGKTLRTRLKSDAVKQEVDRHEDLLCSALRAIYAISKVPNIEFHEKFTQMMAQVIESDPAMMARYQSVQTETEPFDMMDLA